MSEHTTSEGFAHRSPGGGTIVNAALPKMVDDFGVPTTDIEWVAVGYLLTYAAVIPAAGWLGDRFGTRRVFITTLIAFVATSLLCGAAQTLDQLIVSASCKVSVRASSRRSAGSWWMWCRGTGSS